MIFVLAMFGLAQAECSLRSLVTTMNLRPGSEASWERTDEWKFDIGSGNVPCRQLELEQIPGVQIVDVRAIIRQTDDSRVVLKADRLEVLPVASLETRTVLHLPELRNRDRLTLRVQRKPHNTAIPIRWRPGWRGAVPSAELVVAGAVDSTAIVAFEDGDSIVLPPAAGMDEPWRWAFSDVPDGHPEPGGSDWLGVEWWVSPWDPCEIWRWPRPSR